MTLHEKHMHRIERVNRSTTEQEHLIFERDLRSWRAGVEDAGLKLDLCAADLYYLERGIERLMCCGVWLDWQPTNVEPPICRGWNCIMPMPLSPEAPGWRDGYCFDCVTEMDRQQIRDEQAERRYQ
jgi:hypothetical protein